MAQGAETKSFGRKRPEHIVILACGDKVRHMTIRPWMAALGFCIVSIFSVGYLAATTYLFVRDDLIGGAISRQARLQHEYEDRISALRQQLDRVTSRQLVDQQALEQKVVKLLKQQQALVSRHGKLDPLYERAEESGLMPTVETNAQAVQSQQAAYTGTSVGAIGALLGRQGGDTATTDLAYAPLRNGMSDGADKLVSEVTSSLKDIERAQLRKISNLTLDAAEKADAIAGIMKRTGVDVDLIVDDEDGLGGPFVEPETGSSTFDESVSGLDAALSRLEAIRDTAKALPYGNPAPGQPVTSRYGNRIDPFLGRLALHAGIDFQAQTGEKVMSTGAGKVIIAGFSGGYGNLVEIDHGHGITTRYGHLSRILVSAGDEVEAGAVIGRAGSTGRSTGPHVHYEVRRNGNAVNPVHFLNAGMKLDTYLN
ncbi:murein DD-endopeptidase MepM/ murein hydrolase activator NlpD [Pseudorhizobium tarimense]|uniref:Murein DD-endopeptidase MepM/ murein hydrolase activator NlpD n=1 Tax=Pseudorhizobium tarimense TaxID=1079109 RepID=A0ABV2H2P2_9HYPH|nr:M23 family metallopeptidase [Pseudorhizobium tarimense]MCJ8518210.1 M23 family metallopeptidase [Pseudorhizobium tarimense]